MEQTCERAADPALEPAIASDSMEHFLFRPLPATHSKPAPPAFGVPPPAPAAPLPAVPVPVAPPASDPPPPEAATSDPLPPALEAAADPAAPLPGAMPEALPPEAPPALKPEYLFEFQSQPAGRPAPVAPEGQFKDSGDAPEPLPEFAEAYFRQMLSQFEVLPVSGGDPADCLNFNPQAVTVIHHLSAKHMAGTLTWDDLDRMETALLCVIPNRALPGQGRVLSARFQEVAGKEGYYPPDAERLPPEALRAELRALLGELQQRRSLLPERSRRRARLGRACLSWVAGLCAAGLAVAGVTAFQPVPHEAEPLLLLLAALGSGALGGFASLLLQAQPSRPGGTPASHPEWEAEDSFPFFLPVQGAVAAAVLFFLLASCLPRPFFSVTLAGTSRLILCGFAAGLAAGALPDFRGRRHRTSAGAKPAARAGVRNPEKA